MAEYIKNKDLNNALIERRKLIEQAELEGKSPPVITDFICKALMMICERFSYKHNWVGYSFREDMVLDAIANCIRYLDKYDPERKNPHAYFTKCAENSFKARIKKEKTQIKVKAAMIQKLGVDVADYQEHDIDEGFDNPMLDYLQSNYYISYNLEDDKKPDVKKQGLENFFETEDDSDEEESSEIVEDENSDNR